MEKAKRKSPAPRKEYRFVGKPLTQMQSDKDGGAVGEATLTSGSLVYGALSEHGRSEMVDSKGRVFRIRRTDLQEPSLIRRMLASLKKWVVTWKAESKK